MTICISAFASDSIVSVSDTMISTGQYSGDLMAVKSKEVHPDWKIMLAGDDITRIVSVLDRIKDGTAEYLETKMSLRQIEGIARKAFQDERRQKATDIVLSVYGLDMAAFVDGGLKRFGSGQFATMKYEIDNTRLDCAFLVSGFDQNGKAHIFTIDDPGESSNHDLYGFWAVGNGANRALSALFHHPYTTSMTDWMAVYCLCEAKFMAESAGRIGKETLITIAHPDRTTDVSFDDDVIKNLWREKGAPRIPPEAAKIVSEMLKSKFKKLGKTRHLPSQTAADQK